MFDGIAAIPHRQPAIRRGRRRIAVIGGGIAGLSAAWMADHQADVTLFEAGATVGGHARTVTVPDVGSGGAPLAVDTGFMVFNRRTYPNLTRLFDILDVAVQPSDMSFSVSLEWADVEYACSRHWRQLFAQHRNLIRPSYLGMLRDLLRFYRSLREDTAARRLGEVTLGAYLVAGSYGRPVIDWHILPMAAAIWSSSPRSILGFPAKTLGNFFRNHGLLDLKGRPQWLTVAGKSRCYVEAILNQFSGTVRLQTPIRSLRRDAEGVTVLPAAGDAQVFDDAILAVHADVALQLLSDADADETAILGAFPFETNRTFLHTDSSLMPRRKAVWSSWNVVDRRSWAETDRQDQPTSVTYWLNRLQGIEKSQDIFVSLNPPSPPREECTVDEIDFRHPQFDQAAVAAQERLPLIQGRRHVWFAGAWCGYGFHEDGLNAGLAVVKSMGFRAPFDGDRTRPVDSASTA
ncbi:MAG: FAD-dependent oxidoreductase [Rhodospirillaceae bacterium]|nr:FAD-dependent oxidoreductase [Rhodospirillaceae bacterium]